MPKNEEEEKVETIKGILRSTLFGILIVILVVNSLYQINAGERGIVLTFGKPSETAVSEGLHVKIPIAQKVVKMDVKTQKYEAELTAASQDLQDVRTKIAINYHLVPETTPELYKTIGLNFAEKVIYPLEQEANKATTAQFTAAELITRRDAVREQMKTALIEKLSPRGIVVEEVSIVDFQFSSSFAQAIEQKVTAEQNALAAKNKLEQIKYEAEQRITTATAEAEAIRIQAQSINSQGGKDYVQLQAISRWDGKLPTYTGGAMPFIDVTQK